MVARQPFAGNHKRRLARSKFVRLDLLRLEIVNHPVAGPDDAPAGHDHIALGRDLARAFVRHGTVRREHRVAVGNGYPIRKRVNALRKVKLEKALVVFRPDFPTNRILGTSGRAKAGQQKNKAKRAEMFHSARTAKQKEQLLPTTICGDRNFSGRGNLKHSRFRGICFHCLSPGDGSRKTSPCRTPNNFRHL